MASDALARNESSSSRLASFEGFQSGVGSNQFIERQMFPKSLSRDVSSLCTFGAFESLESRVGSGNQLIIVLTNALSWNESSTSGFAALESFQRRVRCYQLVERCMLPESLSGNVSSLGALCSLEGLESRVGGSNQLFLLADALARDESSSGWLTALKSL